MHRMAVQYDLALSARSDFSPVAAKPPDNSVQKNPCSVSYVSSLSALILTQVIAGYEGPVDRSVGSLIPVIMGAVKGITATLQPHFSEPMLSNRWMIAACHAGSQNGRLLQVTSLPLYAL